MSDENSRGSEATIPMELPNYGGTAAFQTQGSVPQQAEGSPLDGGEQINVTQEVKAEEKSAPEPEALESAKGEEKPQGIDNKADSAHVAVIETLEDKFDQLEEGLLDQEQLKEWFSKHKNLADIANRSKRLKDQYRELMEAPVAKVEKPMKEIAVDDKPLTIKDLQRYDEERDARILSKTLERERRTEFEKFASDRKVLDKEAEILERNARALHEVNSDWSWQDALKSAYNVIRPSKSAPLNISTGSVRSPEVSVEKLDATSPGGIQLISPKNFSGGQLD